MDSPTPLQTAVPVHSRGKDRRAVLIIIIVVALAVIAWVVYQQYAASHKSMTFEEQHDAILNAPHIPVPADKLTAEEKAAILNKPRIPTPSTTPAATTPSAQ